MVMAFRTPEAVFIEDIETANIEVVDVTYEREAFGHRALIHAPIYYNNQLYGILEPCVFGYPREWTDDDRAVINFVQPRAAIVALNYLQQYAIN